jgi:hypothetical protein
MPREAEAEGETTMEAQSNDAKAANALGPGHVFNLMRRES